jgi:hypothetical protein
MNEATLHRNVVAGVPCWVSRAHFVHIPSVRTLVAWSLAVAVLATGPGLSVGAVVSAWAAERGDAAGQSGVLAFDIPAQPLETALSAYGVATRIQLFVDAELTTGRQSAALKGVFSSEDALQNLLAATGLVARRIGDQGFTLVSLTASQAATITGGSGAVSPTVLRFNAYSAAIQDAIRGALCHQEETRPGPYRTLVRLWIGKSGAVSEAELLTSTGDSARDAVLSRAFHRLAVGTSPPADLPQPVTLLVTSGSQPPGYCSEAVPALRRADARRESAP